MRVRFVALPVVASMLALAMLALAIPSGRAQERSPWVHHRYVTVQAYDGSYQRALVMFPRRAAAREFPEDHRLPIVVALHGRGESARGRRRGFLGWSVDYWLPEAYGVLSRAPVPAAAYRSFVTPEHLASVNATLRQRRFEGPMVVTPYVPDLLAPGAAADVERYAAWLAGPFLEQVRAQFPAAARGRESTGIDGVSLGGWIALEAGLRHPEAFGAVGAIQPAITGREQGLAERAARAGWRGATQHVRLLTSEQDPLLAPTRRLSELMRERRVAHELVVLPGPHNYEFNRGPGGLEMLLFQWRALKKEAL